MELRRSRRLQGLEPEVVPLAIDSESTLVIHNKLRDTIRDDMGICHRTLGILGSFLATLTLARAVVAVACAPGYCFF